MSFDFEYWSMLEPMKYFDNPNPQSPQLVQKRQNMIDNLNNEYIATQKWDGEWGMFVRGNNDNEILIRSRSISKVTGKYGDKTALLPHLVNEMKSWPIGTVILAEICWPELGKMSTDVGTILRCLPERAIKRQEMDHWLVAKVFDILCWNGENIMEKGYYDRLKLCDLYFPITSEKYFNRTNIYEKDFDTVADDVILAGGEGIVIERKDYKYEPGKRAAWKTLKVKQKLPIMELPIFGTVEPTREYQGKEVETWPYWEKINKTTGEKVLVEGGPDCDNTAVDIIWQPVSKAYFYGWKMGVKCDYDGVEVDVSSGLTDDDREWLATKDAQRCIKNGQLYAVIKAMCVATLGGLRHPVILRMRIMDAAMVEKIEVE